MFKHCQIINVLQQLIGLIVSWKTIKNNKTKTNKFDKSCIYQLNCGYCSKFCIKKTGRSFKTRDNEHTFNFNFILDPTVCSSFISSLTQRKQFLYPQLVNLFYKNSQKNYDELIHH